MRESITKLQKENKELRQEVMTLEYVSKAFDKHIPSLCGYKPNEFESLKNKWYKETQHPLSRSCFKTDYEWNKYRRQLDLADKIIYYDSSSTKVKTDEG